MITLGTAYLPVVLLETLTFLEPQQYFKIDDNFTNDVDVDDFMQG